MLPKTVPFQLRIRCRDAPSTSRSSKQRKCKSTSQAKPRAPSNSSEADSSCSKPAQSKTSNWRDNIKATDPERYAKILEHGKNYGKLKRLDMSLAKSDLKKRNLSAKEKKKATKLVEELEKYNAGCARRMAKMRAKEKEGGKGKPKKLTRTQQQLKKQKNGIIAEKRRKERAAMTPTEKKAYLAHRRHLYALNKQKTNILAENLEKQRKELEIEKNRVEELERSLIEQRLALERKQSDLHADGHDVRSSAARRKSLQRARKMMPRQAAQYANTTVDLIDKASPKKAALFRKRNIKTTSDKRMEAAVYEAVATSLLQPKQSSARRSMACSLHVVKKYRLQRKAATHFGVSRKLLTQAKKYTSGRKQLPESTVQAVHEFYEAISNSLPDKKMVSKKTGLSTKLIDRSIILAYRQFKKTQPDVKVSVSKFFQLRPRHIKTQQQARYRGCLCEYCANVTLKLKVINAHLASAQATTFKGAYDLSKTTMCEKPPLCTDYHHPDCLQRKCKTCGVHKLDERLAPLLAQGKKAVQWKQWDLISQQVQKGATKTDVKKRALVTKTGDMDTLIKELKQEAHAISEHLFIKDWQNAQLQSLRKNLPRDACLCILDFAENYKCTYQDEVQGAYWTQNAATVHPIVCYYKCNGCEEVVTESMVFISDDLTHDHHAVNAFQTGACKHLKDIRQLKLSKIYRYSDGCGQQYKSKGPFSDVSYASTDFGVPIHHNFSGSRHGKGASDGESAVVKSAASRAVKAGTVVIKDAEELFQYSQSHLSKTPDADGACTHFRRTSFYVPSASIDRDRAHRHIKTVPGTMKVHSIKTVEDGVVATRNLSCFCPVCLHGDGETCQNSLYIQSWKEVSLYNRRSKTANHTDQSDDKMADAAVPDSDQDDDADAANHTDQSDDKMADAAVPDSDQDDDDTDAANHTDQSTDAKMPDAAGPDSDNTNADDVPWSVGSWILVDYDGIRYPGRVISIVQTDSQVECMTASGAYWKWPAQPDVTWYPKSSVIKPLEPPIPVSASRGSISMFQDL